MAASRLISFAKGHRAQQRLADHLNTKIIDDILLVCDRTGLTFAKLAARVGRSRAWYHRIRCGAKGMSPELLAELGEFVEQWEEKERRAKIKEKKTKDMTAALEARRELRGY